jgi:cytochrome c553
MAVDLMYQGLVGPSDEAWKKGARQLGQSPLTLKDLPKDPKLTKEIAALVGVIHTLADKADAAVAPNARATLYGDVIATCAECHGLHGKVWGPGLPKK